MTSIPVGVSTWIFGDASHADVFKSCSRVGVSCIELFVDIFRENAGELRRRCGAFDLSVVSLTPDNVDIGHVDTRTRSDAVDYYKTLVGFAKEVGAAAITCHEFVGRNQPQDNMQSEWARLVESCRQITDVAERSSIGVFFEPLNAQLVSSAPGVRKVVELIDMVDSSAFRMMLDTYHVLCQECDPVAEVAAAHEYIAAVQLSNSRRHAIGTEEDDLGIAPWLKNLVEGGFSGPWILECTRELKGPNLSAPAINLPRLEKDIRQSMFWLQSQGLLQARMPAHPHVDEGSAY